MTYYSKIKTQPSKTSRWELTNGCDKFYFSTLKAARLYAQVCATGISIIKKLN